MKRLLKPQLLPEWSRLIAVLPVIMLTCSQVMAQDDPIPGTLPSSSDTAPDLATPSGEPASPPSVVVATAPLAPVYTESGALTLSVDGMGTAAASGTIRVQKPPGATVRRAFLGSATTGGSRYQLATNDISLAGTTVVFSLATSNAINSYNYWGEVTDIVKPIVDAAPVGIVNLTVDEGHTLQTDGEVLAVVFDDPNVTSQNTVSLLFGAQKTAGDTFSLSFAEPLDPGNTNLVLDMSLGISYGFQSASVVNQYSRVDVNGQRLTSSAGGQDDGQVANGALITVGGIGDSDANPPPFAPPSGDRTDDELYNLVPFITNGTTSISVYTLNPSSDDNIFFAAFFLKSATAIVNEGILLSPVSATNNVGTTHTVVGHVLDDQGNGVVGKTVSFAVVSGPHAGTTGTAVTDTNGLCSFTYLGTAPGLDSITASFVDDAGKTNTASAVSKLWVMASHQEPVLVFNPVLLVSNDIAQCSATVTGGQLDAGSYSPQGSPLHFSLTPPPPYPVGTNVVLFTATDTNGLSSSTNVLVIVVDAEPPVFACSTNKVVECGSSWDFDAPTAIDNCSGTNVHLSVLDTTTNAGCGSTFTATRVWIAYDAVHNASTCTQVVAVVDTTAPDVVCPPSPVVEFVDEHGATATFVVSATDTCSGIANLSASPPSGTLFPIGISTVLVQAADYCGNTGRCSFAVQVLGALGVKSNILNQLVALRATLVNPNQAYAQKFDSAIEHLRNSLDPSYWIDETHLDLVGGNFAINQEKLCVSALDNLINTKNGPVPATVLQGFIDRLIKCDRLLAVVSINDAAAAGLNPAKIAEDWTFVAKGDDANAARKYENGIEQYRNAWRHALNLRLFLEFTSNGGVRIQFVGNNSPKYRIDVSSNLVDWTTLTTCTADSMGNVIYTDREASQAQVRFYRAVQQ